MDVNTLSQKLNEDLKLEISPGDYIHSVDQIFEGSYGNEIDPGQILVRAFQDHRASNGHIQELVRSNVSKALNVFSQCGSSTIPVIAECFNETSDSLPLLWEIRRRLRCNDIHTEYLLSLTIQLLNKFNYDFENVRFLVREISLKMDQEAVRPLALVIFAILDKQFKQLFDDHLIGFLESLIIEAQSEDNEKTILIVINILTELYPALSALCTRILLGQEFQDLLNERSKSDKRVAARTLQLLSIACVDETARSYIAEHYLDLLEESLKIKEFKLYATLVLIKTWAFTKLKPNIINQLGPNLMETLEDTNEESEEIAIEGLAYLSLRPSTKALIRAHGDICLKIIERIKDESVGSTNKYGALVICANLSKLPGGAPNSEQSSMLDLKSYSELKTPSNDAAEEKEDEDDIIAFNQDYILDLDVIGALKTQLKQLTGSSRQQAGQILYNVTRTKENINACIKQGGVVMALEILANSDINSDGRVFVLRALTRMLILTNPATVFQRFSALNALPYLFELLPDPDDSDKEYSLSTRDSFEALLALTNLATLSDNDDLGKKIVANLKYWLKIENSIVDETKEVRRSSLELCCNLMANSLHLAVKFFNFDNPRSVRNFKLLVKLLYLDDIESQRAVAAIFANIASTVPFIAQELSTKEELIEAEIQLLQTQSTDRELRHRVLVFFHSVLTAAPPGINLLKGSDKFLRALLTAKTNEGSSSQEYSSLIESMIQTVRP
ncbi:LAFE_0D08218g1_1 [Lachancea fermentati]|uniref:LAFE_0D08218g1_1 n=1 Tax=Lachancea fermentati TaxID=4955 RepID=A0A1G4MBJ6_LACFM|nr:LAFE_0D08218g1_1 [Lachancea fermentati]